MFPNVILACCVTLGWSPRKRLEARVYYGGSGGGWGTFGWGTPRLPGTGLPVMLLVALAVGLVVGGMMIVRAVRMRKAG
ncbi:hypothetical protein Aph01nite_15760 [Acrocarpospora phusangensis]|uniref:Uncharacterized protein n=1 Tax=Acrocarpospora phusangensis TaxID=1070424 RepID=A0A919UIZ9_9ACTN|nr:hypothetical protein Aph01nite_15760 [Acrocarpospora phusangensis]